MSKFSSTTDDNMQLQCCNDMSLGSLLPVQQSHQPSIHSCAALNKDTQNDNVLWSPFKKSEHLSFTGKQLPAYRGSLLLCSEICFSLLSKKWKRNTVSSATGQEWPCDWHDTILCNSQRNFPCLLVVLEKIHWKTDRQDKAVRWAAQKLQRDVVVI